MFRTNEQVSLDAHRDCLVKSEPQQRTLERNGPYDSDEQCDQRDGEGSNVPPGARQCQSRVNQDGHRGREHRRDSPNDLIGTRTRRVNSIQLARSDLALIWRRQNGLGRRLVRSCQHAGGVFISRSWLRRDYWTDRRTCPCCARNNRRAGSSKRSNSKNPVLRVWSGWLAVKSR